MSSSGRGREMRRDIADELDRLGLKGEFSITNGSHQVVEFSIGGRRRRYFFPFTPGDSRAPKNAICGIRRMVRGART